MNILYNPNNLVKTLKKTLNSHGFGAPLKAYMSIQTKNICDKILNWLMKHALLGNVGVFH